jgi:hypothetical protein
MSFRSLVHARRRRQEWVDLGLGFARASCTLCLPKGCLRRICLNSIALGVLAEVCGMMTVLAARVSLCLTRAFLSLEQHSTIPRGDLR